MIVQWKDELESKFGLTFDLIDRERLGELRRQRGFSVNPWIIYAAPERMPMSMRIEWLRADDGTPACWACFLVYPDKVSVLATLTNGLVDRDMTVDAARQF
jgi:hypothetical protein